MFWLGLQYEFVYSKVSYGEDQETDDDEIQPSTRYVTDGISGIDSGLALDSLRRQLERPGHDQREREASKDDDYQKGKSPVRQM
jgi:hypothetical protein